MHIPDGVLSAPVLVVGGVATAAALGLSLRTITDAMLPKVAVVSAMFFVASLITVPIGPTSVHLVLSGLMGLVLGWATIPAVFVGLLLQAIFFGFGGLTALGVTTINIALPGVFWAVLLSPVIARAPAQAAKGLLAGLVALLAIMSSACMVIAVLAISDPAFFASALLVLMTYIPLALGEALITGFAVVFLARVKPGALTFGLRETRNG
jgi:cobalt/nickel transport system permease protein